MHGGENIPVIGLPDHRLGERGCAFVTLNDNAQFDLAGLQTYVEKCELTRHYWPERVEVIAKMPRTASGKIQKFVPKQ